MALQTKTLQATGSTGHHYFTLEVVENSTNIATNTSSITWRFILSPKEQYWDWEGWGSNIKYSATVNGDTVSGTIPAYDGLSTVELVKRTNVSIQHNADGNKNISLSFSINSNGFTQGYLPGTASTSDTMALTYIPRYASITSVPATFTDLENPTIRYSNPAGNSISHLQACISWTGGADIAYRDINKTGSEYTFPLTSAERAALQSAVTSGTTRTVNFFVWSKIGDGESRDYLPSTYSLTNATPTLNPTVSDESDYNIDLVGNTSKAIKGHNDILFNVNATARKGATIASQAATNRGYTIANTSAGYFFNVEDGNFTFAAKDSRGNTVSASKSITIIDYARPTIGQEVDMELVGETGANIKLKVSGTFYNINFGLQQNTASVQYRYKTENGTYSSWTAISTTKSGNNFSAETTITGLDYGTTYVVQSRVSDKINVINTVEYPINLTPVFDWSKTDFNFNVPVKINNTELDYVVEQGTSGIWRWRKWNSGVSECWGTTGQYTLTINVQYYSGFTTAASSYFAFPTNLFVDIPGVSIQFTTENYGLPQTSMRDLSGAGVGCMVLDFGNVERKGRFTIVAKGRWK